MDKKTVKDVDLKNKRVIFRVAYDVPLEKVGDEFMVSDDYRIRATLPTLSYLLEKNCQVVILTWLKRPGGKVVPEYRLNPVAKKLEELIGRPVKKLDDCVGPEVEKEVEKMLPGEIVMLENVRFYRQEEENDPEFASRLARLGEMVVFDAFGQAHRTHASTASLLQLLPSVAGFLVEQEMVNLEKLLKNPKKPFVVILGGAKISDKIKAFKNLLPLADIILVVGALANIFLKAKGREVGASLVESTSVDHDGEKDWLGIVKGLLEETASEKVELPVNWDLNKIQLPLDLVAASKISETAGTQIINWETESINLEWLYLDIGPKTIKLFGDIIKKAGTIFWNGPAGYFEMERFTEGTRQLAQAVAESSAISIVGGGDTEKIVKKFSLEGKFTYVSTGGGASLKFLAGEKLPALELLPAK